MIAVFIMAGCDPVRTTNQTVTLILLDRETNAPVNRATVQMKYVWANGFPDAPADYIKKSKKDWEEGRWDQGSSDSEGRVVIRVVITALDWTRGSIPPVNRVLTGDKYVMRVTPINGKVEELEIQLNPKATGETENFLVEIVEIGPATYEKPLHGNVGVVMLVMIGLVTLMMALVFIWGCARSRRLGSTWTSEIQRMIWTLQCRDSKPRQSTQEKIGEPTAIEGE